MGDVHSLVGILLTGLAVGWVASQLVQGKGMGILPDMVVGVIGAFIGGFLGDKLHIHVADGVWGTLALSLLGAVVLLVLIRLIKPAH